MKISIDGKEILTLSETQKKVIQNDIPIEIFESDMARRLQWTVEHPCDVCYDSRKKSWMEMLKGLGVRNAPVEKLALAKAVFEHYEISIPPSKDKDLVVSVNDIEAFRVTPTHKRMLVLNGNIDPDEYCQIQMKWILQHKYERCMERLRLEWEPKLASRGLDSVPTDDDVFAELVFSQAGYKNRSAREASSGLNR